MGYRTFSIDLPDAIRSNTMLRLIELLCAFYGGNFRYHNKQMWFIGPVEMAQYARDLGFKVCVAPKGVGLPS